MAHLHRVCWYSCCTPKPTLASPEPLYSEFDSHIRPSIQQQHNQQRSAFFIFFFCSHTHTASRSCVSFRRMCFTRLARSDFSSLSRQLRAHSIETGLRHRLVDDVDACLALFDVPVSVSSARAVTAHEHSPLTPPPPHPVYTSFFPPPRTWN